MGKRTIKKIKRTLRIPCDDLEYEAEDGEVCYPRAGQWVEIRKKTSGQDYATLLRIIELFPSGDGETDERKNVEAMTAMIEFLPGIYQLLAHKITAWNWIDIWDDGEPPLPEPEIGVMETLDLETDLIHLITTVMGAEETPKNSPSPS